MLTIYKRVEKTRDNLYGIEEITDISKLLNPILLNISAQENFDKSIYGIIKIGAQAARVHTTEENAANFKINEMPVDFLGVRFCGDETYKNSATEIVDKLVLPILLENKQLSPNELINNSRKLNFLTYCDGTEAYVKIEKLIEQKLNNLGYTSDVVELVLKNMTLVAIGTMVDTSTINATTVTFIDVADSEIWTEKTEDFVNALNDNQTDKLITMQGHENNFLYIYSGTGNHVLKEYLSNKSSVKPVLCETVTTFLESSLRNDIFMKSKVDSQQLFHRLKEITESKLSNQELLMELDSHLSYKNTEKYTDTEAELRNELDLTYRELVKMKRNLEYSDNYTERLQKKLHDVSENIRNYSSETAFLQIMTASKMWQAPKEIFNEKTDKDIREEYENAYSNHYSK